MLRLFYKTGRNYFLSRVKSQNIIRGTSTKEKVKACFSTISFPKAGMNLKSVCLRHYCPSDLLSVAEGAGSKEAFVVS